MPTIPEEIKIEVVVDTTELDQALEKARELERLLEKNTTRVNINYSG